MNSAGVFTGMLLVAGGTGAVAAAGWKAYSRRQVLAYLSETGGDGMAQEEVSPSFGERVLRPFARQVAGRARSLYPSRYLDRLHHQLLCSGLSTVLSAEEMATIQLVVAALGLVLAIVVAALGGGSPKLRFMLALILALASVLGPSAWLARRLRQRTESIERELPDILDLLTIGVESGLGLEQAMEATCANFDSPMSEELARTLQELSLGLSRHEALENLKHRSESTDLASFVVVLTQADVLGMPIGRVLRTQADEMRERRRSRAREKAAKLPVKIIFPTMFFILPPLMVIIIGPAVASIGKAFGV